MAREDAHNVKVQDVMDTLVLVLLKITKHNVHIVRVRECVSLVEVQANGNS